jgi:hypothetical protein
MKIIFLDIDGVLNNRASLAEGIHILNEKCQLIGRIVDATEAQIVISSTWRMGMLIETLNIMLWKTGGPYNAIIAATPVINPDNIRGEEIQAWMDGAKERGKDISHYIIIDDDSDMLPEQMEFFIKTDMRTGLTTKAALQAIEILNRT